ncbi:MAG: bifunctional DNA-formamidopyrimidine glycosylase/DNA-(apurinic or apyrimidinic site) lyase [Calditrichota bacterium]
MPELPEVETVVRIIRPRLEGRVIHKARFAVPRQLAPQTPRGIAAAIRGVRINEVNRRGKYILLDLSRGTLLIHLRMTGRLYVRTNNGVALQYERAWLELDQGQELLAFRDPRTLGVIRFFKPNETIAPIDELGWEPLSETVEVAALKEVLSRRTIAIKPLLLDQSVWAGIGNIYASEALWEAQIDPRQSAARLNRAQLQRLIEAVPSVLRRAVDRGGSTLKDFASPDGKPGNYQREFRVYDRVDEPCLRCGQPIIRIVQAQRSTYYCRNCQKRR